MKKIFKIISLLGLLNILSIKNICANNEDQGAKAKFEILNETNKTVEKETVLNEISTFDLKITIPKDWKIYSNEKQAIGKSLSISIQSLDSMDKKYPKLEVQYPKSKKNYPIPNDKSKINYIYSGDKLVKVKTFYYGQENKELLIDYTMCSKNLCINHKDKVHFGNVKSKPIL